MKINKKIWLSLLLVFAMVLGTVGCAKADPVATINGEELSEPLYRAYLYNIKMQMEEGFGPQIWELDIEGENMGDVAKERALESAVAMSVTADKAEEMNIELTEEDKEEASEIAENYVEQFKEDLEEEGITKSVMEEMMESIVLSQKVLDELAEQFSPSEDSEELNEFIEENQSFFEEVRAQHVLLNKVDPETGDPLPEAEAESAHELAEEVLAKALDGEDMGELATEYSEDPGSKEDNGEYTFPRGQMVPEFEEVAFNLEEGEIHPELVETDYGYHIVKTLENLDASEEEMKEAFEENQKAEYVNNEIDELVESAEVETTDLYDEITVVPEEDEEDIEYESDEDAEETDGDEVEEVEEDEVEEEEVEEDEVEEEDEVDEVEED